VHDLDFQRRQITVRQGKGGKDRRTMLPSRVGEKLRFHLEGVRRIHRQDLAEGYGRVQLPYALARKYPHAPVEWGWQWVFPQHNRWSNADTGEQGRHQPVVPEQPVQSGGAAEPSPPCGAATPVGSLVFQ
jgi:hypothetical protein